MISKYIKSHKIVRSKDKNPFTTFNPLTSHLYFKISFLYLKTFINYYKENVEIFKRQEEQYKEINEEEEEDSSNNIIITEKSDYNNDSRMDTEQLNLPSHERGKETNKNLQKMPSSIGGSSNHYVKSNTMMSGIH